MVIGCHSILIASVLFIDPYSSIKFLFFLYLHNNELVNVGHSLVRLSVSVALSTLLLPQANDCGGGLVSVQGLDCLLG